MAILQETIEKNHSNIMSIIDMCGKQREMYWFKHDWYGLKEYEYLEHLVFEQDNYLEIWLNEYMC